MESAKSKSAPLYFSETASNKTNCVWFLDIKGCPWCQHPIVVTEYKFGRLNSRGQRIGMAMRSCRKCEYRRKV